MPPKKEAKTETVDPATLLGRPGNNVKVGILGLPNVGKSTMFNALTNQNVAAENFPFCTIDPSEARAKVPDERFEWLCEHFKPASKVPAYLTVVDIAGLVKGASEGNGLGNAFLSHVKAVDAIFHVCRAFDDEDVVHVEDSVDPVRDLQIITSELIAKDIEFVTNALEKLTKSTAHSKPDKAAIARRTVWTKALEALQAGKTVRSVEWKMSEIPEVNELLLLTAKPIIYLANMSEKDYLRQKNKWLVPIKTWIDENAPGEKLIPFSAAVESNLVALGSEAAANTWCEENKTKSSLPKIITTGYEALRLQYFFTGGPDEVRAWTIRQGSKAPQAAGVIHTDFERGFIKAEVYKFDDLKEKGSEAEVKAAGKYHQQGKEYVMQDGDIVFFKFNVTAPAKKK